MINYFNTFIKTLNHPNNRKLNQLTLKLPALVELGNNIKCICYPDSSYGSMVVYTRYPDIEVVNGIKKNLPKIYPRLVENINLNSLNKRVRLNNSLVSGSNKPVFSTRTRGVNSVTLSKIVKTVYA